MGPPGHFGETEIEDLGLSAFGDEQIGGLQVAVDDSGSVGNVEGVGDLDAEIDLLVHRKRFALDAIFQSAAFEVLHHDVVTGLRFSAVFDLVFADVVDGADVGMIEGGGGAGLAAETLEGLGIAGDFIGQEFEGDEALQAGVFRFVDDAHAATAELFDDAVVRDGLANHAEDARMAGRFILKTGQGLVNEAGVGGRAF